MEQLELSYTANGHMHWYKPLWKIVLAVSTQTKHIPTYVVAIPLPGIYPTEMSA